MQLRWGSVSGESISRAIWLYGHFCRSQGDVAELLFVGGAIVSCEAICQ